MNDGFSFQHLPKNNKKQHNQSKYNNNGGGQFVNCAHTYSHAFVIIEWTLAVLRSWNEVFAFFILF
jgi:hypothetical protein